VDRAKGSLSRMPDEVPASWYAADVPPEHTRALDELRRVQPVLTQRTVALREGAGNAGVATAVAEETPSSSLAAGPLLASDAWGEWKARQEAYSYWWWRWAHLRGVQCAGPWAALPAVPRFC